MTWIRLVQVCGLKFEPLLPDHLWARHSKMWGGKERKKSIWWNDQKNWKDDRACSQSQLTGVYCSSDWWPDQQVSHPDPCSPPAQQIDQKGLSSVETTVPLDPRWWMPLGTLPLRVTAGWICPRRNLMYDPGFFGDVAHKKNT